MLKEFKIEPMLKDRAPHQTKAIVAMSGGVDSSVIGVTLQIYGTDGNPTVMLTQQKVHVVLNRIFTTLSAWLKVLAFLTIF
nr:unnamed protein product [Callosobruchus chinensis]